MPTTQNIFWIALPNGVLHEGGTRYLRLSVFVNPRLRTDQGNTLALFPDFLDWGTRMQPDRVAFVLETDELRVPAAIISEPPEPELWKALFTPDIPIHPYEFDDFSNRPIVSFPVSGLHNYIKGCYQEIASHAPFDPPITGDRSALEGQIVLEKVFGELIDFHQELEIQNEEQLSRLLNSTLEEAREIARNRQAASQPSGELIVPHGMADRSVGDTRDAFYRTMLFHYRPANAEPVDHSNSRENFTEQVDFHQMLSALSDFPELLRRLGLIFDLKVPVDELPQLIDTEGFVRIVTTWTSAFPPKQSADQTTWTADFSPWTSEIYTAIQGQDLFTAASNTGVITGGLWIPDNEIDLVQMDIDGAALKTLNFAGSLARANKMEDSNRISDTVDQTGIPALRTKGISVIRNDNAKYLNDVFNRSSMLNEMVNSDPPKMVELYAEDLTRGYRLDVFEARTDSWRSLHRRTGTYTVLNTPGTVLHIADEGFIQPSVTSNPESPSMPPDPGRELYVHESLFTWDNWSLSAPRPGKSISDSPQAPNPDEPDTMPQHVHNTAMTQLRLETSFKVQDNTLPRLRFGQDYRLRVRTVDLAGNGPTLDEATAIEMAFPEAILPKDGKLTYNRFEPVNPPELVPRQLYHPSGNPDDPNVSGYSEGESLERMVIRSNYDQSSEEYAASHPSYPFFNERHIAAPKASLHLVETHGLLDEALDAKHTLPPDQARNRMQEIYKLAKRESGSMSDTSLPSVRFIHTSSDPASKDGYAVHTEEQLILPYLPDPWAQGVVFQVLPGLAPDALYPVKFGGAAWHMAPPFRLRLVEGNDAPVWEENMRILTVGLPKSEIIRVRVSSMYGGTLNEAGLWRWLNEASGQGRISDEQRQTLQQGILDGRHWMFTPYREITLVHAVQQPLLSPKPRQLEADRPEGSTAAYLRGLIELHAPSTSKLDILAEWTEPRDDPSKEEPDTVNATSHVMEIPTTLDGQAISVEGRIDGCHKAETDALRMEDTNNYASSLIFNCQQAENSRLCFQSELDDPHASLTSQERRHLQEQLNLASKVTPHEFGDTKYRRVCYRVSATSRFREYFTPALSDNLVRYSQEIQLDILSTALPAAPRVLFALPTFGWDQTTGADGNVTSERRGGGVRVYLDRPWWSSGDGELLGVVVGDFLPLRHFSMYSEVTLCGRDPVRLSPEVRQLRPESFKNSNRVWWTKTKSDNSVQVVGYDVQWDRTRKLWFCDLDLDIGDAYYPFIRLALARFQPNSLYRQDPWSVGNTLDLRLSPIVLVDLVQTAPNRTVTVTRDAETPDLYSISVSGVAYTAQSSPSPAPSQIVALIQRRANDIEDAILGWRDLPQKAELVPGAPDERGIVIWQGRIRIPADSQSDRLRIVVQEFEELPAAPPVGSTPTLKERLVYVDTIPLYDVISLARQLLALSSELTASGRHTEAAAPALAAVEELRGFHDRKKDYRELFAEALYTLAVKLKTDNRLVEAVPVAEEAVQAYRGLAEEEPDRFGPLLNQAEQLANSVTWI